MTHTKLKHVKSSSALIVKTLYCNRVGLLVFSCILNSFPLHVTKAAASNLIFAIKQYAVSLPPKSR
jgi:hypothetical protein